MNKTTKKILYFIAFIGLVFGNLYIQENSPKLSRQLEIALWAIAIASFFISMIIIFKKDLENRPHKNKNQSYLPFSFNQSYLPFSFDFWSHYQLERIAILALLFTQNLTLIESINFIEPYIKPAEKATLTLIIFNIIYNLIATNKIIKNLKNK